MYVQTKIYSASDFCDTSHGDCTVELGVNRGDLQEHTIVLSKYISPSNSHTFLKNGNSFAPECCAYVGYLDEYHTNNGNNYVMRYKFTITSSQAANKVKIIVNPSKLHSGDGTLLRFYIGASSTSHLNASSNALYNGNLISSFVSLYSGYGDIENLKIQLTGISGVDIEQNTTYYLWMFSGKKRMVVIDMIWVILMRGIK